MTTASDPAHLVGHVVAARYTVVALLGRGSMGAVYEAERLETGARVAIKILLPDLGSNGEIAARFTREGKTMAMLGHRNIVRLLDLGCTQDGMLFMVTELIRGASLREVIESGIIDPARALGIIRQVLEAAAHAHAHGVIHRDLKPENIMLVDGGDPDADADLVKVLDFGVAKLLDDTQAVLGEAKLTRTGHNLFGSPPYIAPEIVLGRRVDARSDLYSIGAIAFELLAGRPPFLDPDIAVVMRMHASAPIPSLVVAAPDRVFTPQLEHLVAEALVKNPELRFPSATEMIAAVTAAAHSTEPLREPPPRSAARPAHASADRVASPTASPDQPTLLIPGWLAHSAGQPRATRRTKIGLGLVALALLVIMVLASRRGTTAGAHPGEPSATPGTAEPGATGSNAARTARALDGEDEGNRSLALGHARLASGHRLDAVNAYERAIAWSPDLGADPQLRSNTTKIVESTDTVAAMVALELLATRLAPPAREVIVDQATRALALEVRHRALAIAERDHFASQIDRGASWLLDLKQASTCEERRAAILALPPVRDDRVIAALRRVRTKFPCVASEADRALQGIEAL